MTNTLETSPSSRLAGRLLIVAFVLCLIGGMTHPIVNGNAHSADSLRSGASPYAQYVLFAGTVALLMGLPLLYQHYAGRLGRLGRIGIGLYLVGNATCAMAHLIVEAFVAVPLAADPTTASIIPADGSLFASTGFQLTQMVGGPVLILGQVLLGIAVVRAQGLPSWIGWLLIVGSVFGFAPLPETPVLTGFLFELPRGLGVAALGLLMTRSIPSAVPTVHAEEQSAESVVID